jgi:Icc protein
VTNPEERADLLRGLLQSCYVIENARERVQRRWGGDFERDAERTDKRAGLIGRLLDDRGFRRPEEVILPHTEWFESLCGSEPSEVPLGAAVLNNFAKWSDVFCEPYLDDPEAFIELATKHARVETEVRTLNENEAFLETTPLPEGRQFVVLTDVHTGSRTGERLARRAVAEINQIAPEFVVIPGDFTDDGEPAQFQLAKEIFDGLECPYYTVLGNHDAVQRSTRLPLGEKLYAETYGIESQDFVVGCGDLQVALVNSTDPTASPFPDWDIARGSVGGEAAGVDSGALRPGQAEELAERLDKTRPTLLVQHHELHPFPGFPPVKFALREEDAYAELEALSQHQLVGVVAGHTHRSAVLKVGDGSVTQLEIPSLKDWPYAYSVVGYSDDGVQVVVRQVSDRDLVWRFAKDLPPVMLRFHLGPLADLAYTFPA